MAEYAQDKKQHGKLPEAHRNFIENSVPRLKDDPRIAGVAVGGSFLLDEIYEFSDLDLVIYIDPSHYNDVLVEREAIVQKMGPLLESFAGEHVGEPRLLICLFGPPLLHIDFKVVSMDDIHDKVEKPTVLWERKTLISSQINLTPAEFPKPDSVWIEKRFWTWIHYIATKIGRGEIFEAIEAVGFIRANVLGPIILQENGARPQGLRKIERYASQEELEKMKSTLVSYDTQDCLRALCESMELYRSFRNVQGNQRLENLVDEYLTQIENQLS